MACIYLPFNLRTSYPTASGNQQTTNTKLRPHLQQASNSEQFAAGEAISPTSERNPSLPPTFGFLILISLSLVLESIVGPPRATANGKPRGAATQRPTGTVINGISLPEGAEATVDVSSEKEDDLRAAYDILCHPFRQFIANESPNWIGVDMFPHWVIDIADNFRVPVFCFSVFSAATMVFSEPPECLAGKGLKKVRPSPESLTSPPEWVTFLSSVAFRRGAEANGSYYLYYNGHLGERVPKILNGCKAVAIRSCKEIEGDYLEVLEKIYQRPVIPVGFFPLDQPEQRDYGEEWLKTFNWLDQRKPKSVVFVGFGSTCKLSKDQVHEIASGLELSNLPFLWSLIKSEKASEIANDVDILPPSFRKNAAGRGLVCMGWVPQVEILANPAIGGSMFHAGWGSVIENLRYGHRLIVLPLVFDQILNARLLVDKGLGIQVEQNEDGHLVGMPLPSV
ncbi:UDP-glycosyltransferase 91A1-like [Macadamia integrifolia]|uniref:UDP-glycosyltransferase 91A1-like n=1 Tax=Macadamia integrifolia TaxID=60698 RepID=UPI001C4E9E9F|nr:UDP-glycosyltransferase 91A1-like [Macadamia integrifolia]